jgi:D-xylose transport system permease protein
MPEKLNLLLNSLNKRIVFMVSLILAIWLIFNVLSGGYILRAENIANLFRQVTVVALLSIGMTLVIVSGNIDLSVGSSLGMFGALTAALITQAEINAATAVILILCLGFLVGCMHGALIHYFNIPSFVVTLGGLIAYRGVTQYIARKAIPIRTPWVKAIAQGSVPESISIIIAIVIILAIWIAIFRRRTIHARAKLQNNPLWVDNIKSLVIATLVVLITIVLIRGEGYPVQVVILLTLAIIGSLIVRYTRFGRYIYAIGGNKDAAHYSGISLAKNVILVFGIMGFMAALAGIISISELSSAAPDIGDLKELEAIAACVIGGTTLAGGSGSIGMSILGALVMASIKNGMSMMGIVAQMQKVILGSVLVLAVALDQWSRRSRRSGK